MKAREFFRRAALLAPVVSGQVQDVTLDASTGKQKSAAVNVGGQTISIPLDVLAPILGPGDTVRLEQHGSAAAAEYRLVGVTGSSPWASGVTAIAANNTTVGSTVYQGGDLIVGSLSGGNVWIEYATGNLYHRIGETVYGIEYADGSQVFGEHELATDVWVPVGYNVLIDADSVELRNVADARLTLDTNVVRINVHDDPGILYIHDPDTGGNALELSGQVDGDNFEGLLRVTGIDETVAMDGARLDIQAKHGSILSGFIEAGIALIADTEETPTEQIQLGIGGTEIARITEDGLRVGDDTDYALIGPDGTVTLAGAATAWDDLMIPGQSVRVGGTAPDFASGFVGDSTMWSYLFDGTGTVEEVHFSVQLPHAWKQGSTIYPHVHFAPTSTNSGDTASRVVRFTLEYTWANIYGTFGSTSTINLDSDGFVPNTSQWKHLLCKNATGISGSGKTLSSMLMCRLFRDGGDAADTYPQDVAFLQFDIHYEIDAFGSSQEYVK
jgi:hypothetical protein